jgi:hypothetical protein
MKFILTVAFIVGGIGIVLSKFVQPSKASKLSKSGLREKTALVVASIFFTYFYIGQSTVFTFSLKILFVVLILFFYIFLSKLIDFYTMIDFSQVHRFTPQIEKEDNIIKALSKVLTMCVATIAVCFSAVLIFNIAIGYVNGNVERDRENMKKLYIVSVEPSKTTLAEDEVIHGYNFGWNVDGRSKLMSSDGQIVTSLWQHDVIRFTVPLQMKTGKRELWIEKPVHENEYFSPTVQSNRVFISIVPRESFFPEADDNKLTRLIKKVKRFVLINIQSVGKYLF